MYQPALQVAAESCDSVGFSVHAFVPGAEWSDEQAPMTGPIWPSSGTNFQKAFQGASTSACTVQDVPVPFKPAKWQQRTAALCFSRVAGLASLVQWRMIRGSIFHAKISSTDTFGVVE